MGNIDQAEAEKHVNEWLAHVRNYTPPTGGGYNSSTYWNDVCLKQIDAAGAIQHSKDLKEQVVSNYLQFCNSEGESKRNTVSIIAQITFDKYKKTLPFNLTQNSQTAASSSTTHTGSSSAVNCDYVAGLIQKQNALQQEIFGIDPALAPVIAELAKLEEGLEKFEKARSDEINILGCMQVARRHNMNSDGYSAKLSEIQNYISANRPLIRNNGLEIRRLLNEISNGIQSKIQKLVPQIVLNEQAIKLSTDMAACAANSGTNIDRVLESSAVGDLADGFASGRLTREVLDRSVEWVKAQRGNVDLSPEELAFKQFMNHTVIPDIGSFEALTGMVDNLEKTGTLSANKTSQLPAPRNRPASLNRPASRNGQEAAKEARGMAAPILADAAKLDSIIGSDKSIADKVAEAARENETHLQGFERLFSGIDTKINQLLAESADLKVRAKYHAKALQHGLAKNERLDEEIGKMQFESVARRVFLPEKPVAAITMDSGLRHAAEGAALADLILPGSGIAGTVLGGLLGFEYGSNKGWDEVNRQKAETGIRNAMISYMHSQKVDVEEHADEIVAIAKQMTELMRNKKFQEEVGSELKVVRIQNAYVTRSLLRSAIQNSNLLSEACEFNGVNSLDELVNAFEGNLKDSLSRFCLGLANSNDISVILAEANGLSGDQLEPHKRTLKYFVENIMKPDIASFISAASKVDVISQSNLLPYGRTLQLTQGAIRDGADPKYAALMANEFGSGVVGVQDVKHIFDFYLHRHGDRQLYDAKLKDGQMVDEYPDKRVTAYSKGDMEKFVDMTKQSMSHGRTSIPQVSDMFLRVCSYEYFRPQAVRTAGTDNVFSENPEAPAAYPMVNATINSFIERMSLGPIGKYREIVGERLDNVIAQTFIDYFMTLGTIHADDTKTSQHRKQLRDSANSDGYGPVFSSYVRRIENDSTGQFQIFMDIYRQNLEKQIEISTEDDRKVLEAHLAALPDPSKTILTPEILRPDSHRARLLAAYEDHTLENLSLRHNSGKQER